MRFYILIADITFWECKNKKIRHTEVIGDGFFLFANFQKLVGIFSLDRKSSKDTTSPKTMFL